MGTRGMATRGLMRQGRGHVGHYQAGSTSGQDSATGQKLEGLWTVGMDVGTWGAFICVDCGKWCSGAVGAVEAVVGDC